LQTLISFCGYVYKQTMLAPKTKISCKNFGVSSFNSAKLFWASGYQLRLYIAKNGIVNER